MHASHATNYTVSVSTDLINKMVNALPGDTITVANGTYSWNLVSFVNTHGSQTATPIVLRAQSFKGVVFSGNTRFEFQITNMIMTGFVFTNGNPLSSAVIKMGKSATQGSKYCRITNIIIDNYNSDSSAATGVTAEWVGIYGTNNRVDHCTFINKAYGDPVVVVWYDNNTFPQKSTSTYHRIDSNYFKHIAYQGANEGENIRVGVSATCNTDGYNIVEYNLFEDGIQVDPEIISNKSNHNTYRYNTFRNTAGGITLRRGRYCEAYGNFFLRDATSNNNIQYGFRIFEKGHHVFNNYIEGVNSNQGTYGTTLCPINISNGESPISDTLTAAAQSNHFPADSCTIAFNTIVNAYGGAGIMIGFIAGGSYPYPPHGVTIANNLVMMAQGTAVYNASSNTALTYFAEGNVYQAPSGLAPSGTIIPSTDFTSQSLVFGARTNGILAPPALARDAAVNTANYSAMLNGKDAQGQTRSAIYDLGADEINGSGTIISYPLDSTLVGAGKPLAIVLPVHLLGFNAVLVNTAVQLSWQVSDEINCKQYAIEWSTDGTHFSTLAVIAAKGANGITASYDYQHLAPAPGNNFYRLKMEDNDGSYRYSALRQVPVSKNLVIQVYPNPAQHFVAVNLNGLMQLPTTIALFDASGREVKRISLSVNTINIPLEGLAAGLYHLQVTDRVQTLYNYAFVVTR
ncbi:Chondroitinase B-domain-containing protein [Russula earlei]|uniref:Chondroitinase B-domain-containing protein n=1 Tax=Russula earlei TaxID=71964 RepID=A0ACC0TS96_9AGAM|nr:Chondroitinase B-domain-containing protein [Russula earlei]